MWQLGGFARRSPTLDRRPDRSPGAAAQGPEMSPERPVARLCALREPRPPRASRSPERAEVRHAEVSSRRSVRCFGPLVLSALAITSCVLRTATPKPPRVRMSSSTTTRRSVRVSGMLPDRRAARRSWQPRNRSALKRSVRANIVRRVFNCTRVSRRAKNAIPLIPLGQQGFTEPHLGFRSERRMQCPGES